LRHRRPPAAFGGLMSAGDSPPRWRPDDPWLVTAPK
jgi:hypothetical protein